MDHLKSQIETLKNSSKLDDKAQNSVNTQISNLNKELAEKDTELVEMRKELVDIKANYNANAKIDTNLDEARRLAVIDADKKKR